MKEQWYGYENVDLSCSSSWRGSTFATFLEGRLIHHDPFNYQLSGRPCNAPGGWAAYLPSTTHSLLPVLYPIRPHASLPPISTGLVVSFLVPAFPGSLLE